MAVSRENTLLMMETLKSIVSLGTKVLQMRVGGEKKKDWRRGIMRWSGWKDSRTLYGEDEKESER